ncbi:class I SAM-dependent methyltransferase [Pontibacter sp. E15-1]|uniref:class I SAM-dependent methyltransferase n=1 Tax=Pontibacter sp. E15-1 TaxID=2919918 RepID=UPI001F4F1ACB|nr:class I SAM-dependent methyltransferase [Pontibacter sp. E15-1]MCJ8166883.1 class I SAM-dependent methyltransferase [Pontibacter sp. E15-1]
MRRQYKGIPINTSKNTHEKVFSLLPQNKAITVLDIPSGAGAFTQRLKDKGYTNVISVDVVNGLQIDHDRFMLGNMNERLPYDDNTVDAVVCIDGIEHINRQFDFVKEVNRILKPQGVFIVSTPNISSLHSRFRWLLTGHHNKCKVPLNEQHPDPSHHIGMLSYPEMRYLLHSNNFKIDTIATNRIKPVAWVYAPLVPLAYLTTKLVYSSEEKDPGQQNRNKEIIAELYATPILFGETMIVRAQKLV